MAIGLDIGSSAVRAAEVDRRRGGPLRLTRYGEVALPVGAVVDGDVVEPAAVADALRKLWDVAGFRRRNVAVGLASQKVTVRQLDMPELPDDEIPDAIRLLASDQLPMPADQALIDHVVVHRPKPDDERRDIRVLLVAAEQELVERLLAAVTAAKLRPVLVDLDAFALLRSIAGAPAPGGTVELVVDIGAAVTKIAVHRDGDPLFVRMVRLGGDASTRKLQQVLELSWEEAEKAKLDASAAMAAGAELEPDDERAAVLQTGVERVITEVGHSLEFFRSQHDDADVQRIVLSGGMSLAPDLAERLYDELELPVRRGDPLRAVEAAPMRGDGGDLLHERPFLAVPVGLALGLLR
ncbi:MAG: type IV pilus assembly protein PilM [Acidimicrobiales bacterium]